MAVEPVTLHFVIGLLQRHFDMPLNMVNVAVLAKERGISIDETKNTITIESKNKKIKILIKKDIIFTIQNKGEKQTIIGSKIAFRPEERVKRI